MLHIERIGYWVPERTFSVEEMRESLGFTQNQVRLYTRFLGLDRIAVAREHELGDLLVAAGEQALAGVDRSAVRHVIHAYTLQFTPPPGGRLLAEVQDRLGLPHASAFGLTHQNCVAGLYGLQVARLLLEDEPDDAKVLVLTGDKVMSSLVQVLPDTTIMGEAAAAYVAGKDPRGHRVIGSALRAEGRFYQCLDLSDELSAEYKRCYPELLADVMREAMRSAGVKGGDIACVIPHNVNRMSWKKVLGDLGIAAEKAYLDNIPKYGHCFASDPFINLRSARAEERVKPGDVAILVGAGLGASFASTVVEIGEGVPE
ncbi:3-oxoacyl-ACP synthase III family protein [Streptomyces sp. NBC_00094]|nr:ketoacyl-ACP synthase III family protein [Streptomyces sp. NBC_00094]MCX5391921.1 ketoacyl-ACP synthase III family protein [Streptomyces sp. NBC_00094]